MVCFVLETHLQTDYLFQLSCGQTRYVEIRHAGVHSLSDSLAAEPRGHGRGQLVPNARDVGQGYSFCVTFFYCHFDVFVSYCRPMHVLTSAHVGISLFWLPVYR